MVSYRCKHCRLEIGEIPFSSIEETIRELQLADKTGSERFINVTDRGTLEVHCICEQCERSMNTYPDYYTIEKWLQ